MNVYGMARAFHELYGDTVKAYAEAQLAPTRFTKILDLTLFSGFSEDPVFIEKMREIAKIYDKHEEPVILIGCGDGYAELISKHKEELSKTFICPKCGSFSTATDVVATIQCDFCGTPMFQTSESTTTTISNTSWPKTEDEIDSR